ncbi:MAG: hypothetical protein LBU13_10310 [Synergistaceae bacterium]|jgi:uncharacterized Zn finger protein|nr:hypothetical protein [Synergistaceae bacterium]
MKKHGIKGYKISYDDVEEALQSKNKEELLDLITELAGHYTAVKQFILEKYLLDSGSARKLVDSLLDEIHDVTSEHAWSRSWDDVCYLPDYSHLEEQFGELAKKGCADELLELGEELWDRGNKQLEESSDEGETGSAIGDCLKIVMDAIPQSSLSKPEQLLWAIERKSEDNFDILCNSYFDFMKSGNYSESDWQEVAHILENRLLEMGNGWSRNSFVRSLIQAYEAGGLKERIIPLYEREGYYIQLVDALLKEGRREEAKKSCLVGYEESFRKNGSIVSNMHKRLLEMAEADGQYDLAAAYYCDDFFDEPTAESYVTLRGAAEKTGCWPAVREAALNFLETGHRPDRPEARKADGGDWPLPPTEVAHLYKETSSRRDKFPQLEPLIRIAILEKRLDDAVKFYRLLPKERTWNTWSTHDLCSLDNAVANAISDSHTDIALSIWRSLADLMISYVKPEAYYAAQPYLKSMKSLYARKKRLEEWKALITELRTTHKRKRRLMEVLAALDNA